MAATRDVFGEDRLDVILAGMNRRARTALRVNVLNADADAVLKELAARNVRVRRSELVAEMLVLDESSSSENLVDSAEWDVQGEIAAVPVDLLDPQPGESVLDLASGRGNKTLQIAGRLRNEGDVEAVERDPRKLAQAQ